MTTDAQISEDLAIVGRTSRARPIALATTLAKLGPVDRPAVGFAARYVYAMRVGRISAGIAAVSAIAGLLLYTVFGHDDEADTLDALAHMPKLWLALGVLGVASTAHIIAARIAISRKPRDPARVGRLSIAASIAGASVFCLFFGMTMVLIGGDPLLGLVGGSDPVLTAAPIVAVMLAALVVARTGIASKRWMLPAGALLLLATIAAGLSFDAGPLSYSHRPPSVPFRAVLAATGTIAIWLVITSVMVRIHARDDQYFS